jgi:hypothetical protein
MNTLKAKLVVPGCRWLLYGAALLPLIGCTLLTPEWHPRRASASDCPAYAMQYCVIDNYGKRCGCAPTQNVEAIARSRQ